MAAQKDLWLDAARIIEQCFLGVKHGIDLLGYGHALQDEQQRELQILYLLGSSLQDNAQLDPAGRVHLHVMPYLFEWFKSHPSMHRRILVPFLSAYWNTSFAKKRIGFSTPRLVEQALTQAETAPIASRAQLILSAVADGLRIPVSTELQAWLRTR